MLNKIFKSLLALSLGTTASLVLAQDAYPSKPIKLVVPYAAGGPADMLARMVAEKLGPRLGQPVVIDNKPGAGGHTGAEVVAKGPADGYTLVLATIAHNGAVKLYPNLRYDPTKELKPVILLAEAPSILIVKQDLPVKSVQELLALARSQPGKLTYGSAGNGSAMHMAAELFRHMSKIDYVHVPYRGGAPAMADLLGGQIDMLFESVGTAHQHIKSGKVRALAVTGTKRSSSLPDVPTVAESGVPGYSSVPWYTISVASGVPTAVVNRLNAEINAVLKMQDLVQRWDGLGVVALGGSPADAVRRNEAETAKWSAVITAANIKLD
ncbi:MAG: ABC transporter substrate-binding protein [Curvibacter sp. GWA2_64_110]|nr:MAG: ABC transporter substrate-binding protein [Curvibacter sp. GWA2_64_110]HCY16077.1 tripartite tricarboxylate transporter substrate binding protein [Curvibacter sp.]